MSTHATLRRAAFSSYSAFIRIITRHTRGGLNLRGLYNTYYSSATVPYYNTTILLTLYYDTLLNCILPLPLYTHYTTHGIYRLCTINMWVENEIIKNTPVVHHPQTSPSRARGCQQAPCQQNIPVSAAVYAFDDIINRC